MGGSGEELEVLEDKVEMAADVGNVIVVEVEETDVDIESNSLLRRGYVSVGRV